MISNLVGPYRAGGCGRFQVSFFKCEKVVEQGELVTAEQVADESRVCIEYSKFDQSSGKVNCRQIWCSPKELNHLQTGLGLRDRKSVV